MLIWAPCLFLWLFAFLDVVYIRNSINRNVPWSVFSVTKLIFTSALILLTIVDIVIVVVNHEAIDIYPVDYYTPVIKIATFVRKCK